MGESLLAIAGLALVSWLVNVLLSLKRKRIQSYIAPESVEYIITIWRGRSLSASPREIEAGPVLTPRKVTVEYSISILADSDEELGTVQAENIAKANEDFQRRFASFLEEFEADMGAVQILPEEDE